MASKGTQKVVTKLFATAGVEINGTRSWDIQVNNNAFYSRVLTGGTLAFGESYMDGWWDCKALDDLICKLLIANLELKVKGSLKLVWHQVRSRIFNLQKISRAFEIGERHYDTGNELFKIMLDKRMIYSCGYWKDADNLDDAQEAKLDLICRKLELEEGLQVLDIGCGWGSFARYAAENYKVSVTGITVSAKQQKLASELCKGLDVKIELMDYRNMNNKFDRVLSIGMFEHVGYKNYRTYFEVVDRCLKTDGLTLLHSIGSNLSVTGTDQWIEKYIFPNSMIPSAKQITTASEGLLRLEDWHNFGPYYDRTLMAWCKNFNKHWDELKGTYSDRFRRMWNFYLLSSAASFRVRKNQLWQVIFIPLRSLKLYKPVR